jgi:hypothetical protein
MIVLKEQRRLTAESCKHLYFSFDLPHDGKELCVRFGFSPSKLEDNNRAIELIRQGMAVYQPGTKYEDSQLEEYLPLKNMLTLSIDSPQGFVGTAHRFCAKQIHKITAQKSSRGFLPQPIEKGRWSVTVSAFHFVTPFVEFDLEVSFE